MELTQSFTEVLDGVRPVSTESSSLKLLGMSIFDLAETVHDTGRKPSTASCSSQSRQIGPTESQS